MNQISKDLKTLNDEVEKEIRKMSDSVESDLVLWREDKSFRALTTLKAAEGGVYDLAKLKPLAVAIELLALGVNKHFGPGRPATAYGDAEANISLVTADAYFVRALELVITLKDDRLVRALCEALALASEGYAFPDDPDAAGRQAAFETAAFRLGSLVGGKHVTTEAIPDELAKEIKNAVFPYPS
jgi:hypothetical protein